MNRQRGFTLIELLVVIAIIALLMSILMPALHHAKLQAETIMCQTRLKHWGLVFKLYTDDWDGYFNHGEKQDDDRVPRSKKARWFLAMRPYYKDEWELLLCPTATKPKDPGQDFGTYRAWDEDHPGLVPSGVVYGSYNINSWTNYLISNTASTNSMWPRPPAWHWKGIHNVKNANTIPLLGDGTHFDAWPHAHDEPPPDENVRSSNVDNTNEMKQFCINRHNGFINMLFVDWGVRRVGLKELWTLKWHREYDTKFRYTLAYYSGPEAEDPMAAYNEFWFGKAAWLARFKAY